MHPIDVVQEAKAPKKTAVQEFCSKMRVLTRERYYQALHHCGALPQDTTSTTPAPSLTPTHSSDSASPSSSSLSTPSSLPCYKIYRNWHAEDLQRQEKYLPMASEDSLGFKEKPTTFLLSYPAEKYRIKTRVPDISPIVNPYINLLGLFFCATAAPTTSSTAIPTPPPTAPPTPTPEDDKDSKKTLRQKPITPLPPMIESSAPVETSPYGRERYQVPFGDLEQRLFPEYRLFFADFYRIKEDWYIQLVVVPSWNRKLEDQCCAQGLVELDVERNPFFFRHAVDSGSVANSLERRDCRYPNSSAAFRKPVVRRPFYPPSSSRSYHSSSTNNSSITVTETKYEYRVYTHPEGHAKIWIELLVGCDVFPTSQIGERVDCLLHENVRKTANTISIQQERHQLATILEGVALDISQMAGRLRGTVDGVITKDREEREEAEGERGEMRKVLELTYRLSRDRTRLGVLQSSAATRRSRAALHAREGWSRL